MPPVAQYAHEREKQPRQIAAGLLRQQHRYWSIVENRRLPGGRVSQRHVLYLGEINSSQERAWRKSVAVLDERTEQSHSLSLFPEDSIDEGEVDESVVRLCLSQLRLCRPRVWAHAGLR